MIKVLDCTLRDGGYVNDWRFSRSTYQHVIRALVDCGVDIVELGYLQKHKGASEGTLFRNLCEANDLIKGLGSLESVPMFCLMMDLKNMTVEGLPKYAGEGVGAIRLAFHKEQVSDVESSIQALMTKGYRVFVQPMVTPAYSNEELRQVFDICKRQNVFSVHIVDSFGMLFREDLIALRDLADQRLPKHIALGYHAHNNLQLAYPNAIDFVEGVDDRDVIIDCSMFGMGRGAGNLHTELWLHYLNERKGCGYDLFPVLECIDSALAAIYRENNWGYSIAHFLSATKNMHPNYASDLINKKTLSVMDIERILGSVSSDKKRVFDKVYAQRLYERHRLVSKLDVNIAPDVFDGKGVVVLASGPSVKAHRGKVEEMQRKGSLLVAVNHCPVGFSVDKFFFSNQKRYDEFCENIEDAQLIVTNNLAIKDAHKACSVADYSRMVETTTHRSDNASVLLFALLLEMGCTQVAVAGLDGYVIGQENYSYPELDRTLDAGKLVLENEHIAQALRELSERMTIDLLTPSLFHGDVS